MKLYNTLSRQIETLKPLKDSEIKMYTCGLTVYSQPQIGNWVAYIYSDVLTRTLLNSGYSVDRVQNITDVGHLVSDDDAGEDKMEKGARAEGLTAWDVAEKYIAIADKEAKALDLLTPNRLVRATDLIDEQISFVAELEKKGFTYLIDDGVYFDTSKLDNYGELARLDIKGLQAGARVDIGGKRNLTDFALWKLSPKGQTRDMEWGSPWGKGFPGWHLECSVIALENLGDQIDIHTGGIDHIPVHHTNEIAQTETLTGKKFSNYWFHNNHLKINGAKLSKSLGNSYTLQDIIDKGFDLEAFKVLVLSSHYRTEGNFTWEILEASQHRLNNFRHVADLVWQLSDDDKNDTSYLDSSNILSALQDDLNTPKALMLVGETLTQAEEHLDCSKKALSKFLKDVDDLLGLHLSSRKDITEAQKKLLSQRQKARDSKDWKTSDQIRDELSSAGININDTPLGQFWYRK